MATSDCKSGKPCSATKVAEQPCRSNDEREWYTQEEDRDECRCREADHHAVLQGSLADADNGIENHREHGCLETEEQPGHKANIAVGRVDPAQAHNGDDTGEDEQ